MKVWRQRTFPDGRVPLSCCRPGRQQLKEGPLGSVAPGTAQVFSPLNKVADYWSARSPFTNRRHYRPITNLRE